MKKTTMKFETAPVSNTPAAQAASRLQPAKGDAMFKQLVLSASLACCSAAVYGATDALPVKASWLRPLAPEAPPIDLTAPATQASQDNRRPRDDASSGSRSLCSPSHSPAG